MKKSLLIAGIAAAVMMSSSLTYAATNTPQDTKTQTKYEKKMPCKCKDCKCKKSPQVKRQGLDERLNLTEEQKQKAHEIRMNGHEKMKPVFEKMKAKKAEIKEIAESDLSQAEKEKKIAPLKNDLRELKKEARQIRMDNTKEFEAILTPEQKAEFIKIKQQARENAKKHHQMKKQNRQNPTKK